jgi:hypothetical protein
MKDFMFTEDMKLRLNASAQGGHYRDPEIVMVKSFPSWVRVEFHNQPMLIRPEMINRTALIVRPAQPYIDWAKSLPDADEILPTIDGEHTVYLVEQIDDDRHFEHVLKRVFAEIFERELFSWYLDESFWPQKRALSMFKKWFSIEYHTCVEDLLDAPLEDDEGD